jgi:hypothetical protein
MNATWSGPVLATGAVPWEGSVGADPGRRRWRTRHERPQWRRRSQGWTGRPDGDGTGGLGWGVPGDGSGGRGSSSRALHAVIGVKRVDSEAAVPTSTRKAQAPPEAADPMSWDGHDVDGRLGSTVWAGSESMVATRSRTVMATTQMGGTGEVRRRNPSTWGVFNSDLRWVRLGLIYWVQLVRSDSINWVIYSGHQH